jgi:N-acetylneuraminic acid mutarotase
MRRVEAYNAATDKWVRKGNLPVDRGGATTATIGGKIYVVGGKQFERGLYKTLYVHDPVSNTWTQKASIPVVGKDLISGHSADPSRGPSPPKSPRADSNEGWVFAG